MTRPTAPMPLTRIDQIHGIMPLIAARPELGAVHDALRDLIGEVARQRGEIEQLRQELATHSATLVRVRAALAPRWDLQPEAQAVVWEALGDDAEDEPDDDCPGCDPVQLRWGLGDVEVDEAGNLLILMSGPDREPYALELDAERAAALRDELPVAGPASGGYPPALPWAEWLDDDDLAELLDAVADVAVPHAPAAERLAALEETLAEYRLIAEADHAQAVAPGPDDDVPADASAGGEQ